MAIKVTLNLVTIVCTERAPITLFTCFCNDNLSSKYINTPYLHYVQIYNVDNQIKVKYFSTINTHIFGASYDFHLGMAICLRIFEERRYI